MVEEKEGEREEMRKRGDKREGERERMMSHSEEWRGSSMYHRSLCTKSLFISVLMWRWSSEQARLPGK